MCVRDNLPSLPIAVDAELQKLLLDLSSVVSHEVTGTLRSLSIMVDWLESDLANSLPESNLGPLHEYKQRLNDKVGSIKQTVDNICEIINSLGPSVEKYWYTIEQLLQPMHTESPSCAIDRKQSLQLGLICSEQGFRCIKNTIHSLLADNQQSRDDMVFRVVNESLHIHLIIRASENESGFARSYRKRSVYANHLVLQQILGQNEMKYVSRKLSDEQEQLEIIIPLLKRQ